MRRIAILSVAVVLAACQPQAPDGAPAEPPADAPADASAAFPVASAPSTDFGGNFHLAGTEPFWSVQIRDGEISLSRPDAAELTVVRSDPQIEGDQAVWESGGLRVSLTAAGPCSDGMSDRVYPYTAEITVGGQTMKGCGASMEQGAK